MIKKYIRNNENDRRRMKSIGPSDYYFLIFKIILSRINVINLRFYDLNFYINYLIFCFFSLNNIFKINYWLKEIFLILLFIKYEC